MALNCKIVYFCDLPVLNLHGFHKRVQLSILGVCFTLTVKAIPDLHGSYPKYPFWRSVTGDSGSTAIALGLYIICSWTQLQRQWELSFGSTSTRGLCGSFLCMKPYQPERGSCMAVRYLLIQTLLIPLPLGLLGWLPTPRRSLFLQLKETSATTGFLPSPGQPNYKLLSARLSKGRLHFPPFSSLIYSWLLTFRCSNVQVSPACVYVEQGFFCWIIVGQLQGKRTGALSHPHCSAVTHKIVF